MSRVDGKGRVTIPAELRGKAGLLPGTEVRLDFDGSSVRNIAASRGKRLVAHLRGRGDILLTTDEIMSMTRER